MSYALLKTAAFIDYEHWYISMKTQHKRPTNIHSWFEHVKRQGDIVDLTFFGNFSASGGMVGEIGKIRQYTSRIIETKSTEGVVKDFTDFIMLDSIYQHVLSYPETPQIILFTGDGHFSSVVSHLRNFCGKTVGVYGISGATSHQLKKAANWCIELPLDNELINEACHAVLDDLCYMERRGGRQATFMQTVRKTAEKNNLDEDLTTAALRRLIRLGVVESQRVHNIHNYLEMINVLSVDWTAAAANGWSFPAQKGESVT